MSVDLTQLNPIAAMGWASLFLGFSSGLELLLTSGLSFLETGTLYYDWGTVTWAFAILALSIAGWALLRSFGRVEAQRNQLLHEG